MRILVTFEAFPGQLAAEQVAKLRDYVGTTLHGLMEAGVVEASGIFVGARGGFFLVNVESSERLFELIGGLVDYGTVCAKPVISVETLGKFFVEHPPS
jgi:hypothetical protein